MLCVGKYLSQPNNVSSSSNLERFRSWLIVIQKAAAFVSLCLLQCCHRIIPSPFLAIALVVYCIYMYTVSFLIFSKLILSMHTQKEEPAERNPQ